MTETALVVTKPEDNPFEGATGQKSELLKTGEFLTICIVGPPKTGKSWLAATAPGFIQYYDFDERAISLAGKPNLNIATLVDRVQTQPTVVNQLEADLANFKYRKDKGLRIPDTVVFDSFTNFKRFLENELMKQGGPNYYREIRLSPKSVMRIPQGWDVVNGIMQYMQYFLAEFRRLMNVIVVFHERDEKDKVTSTKLETKYTGRKTIDPQFAEPLLTSFNEVWNIDIASGSGRYEVQVQANHEFRASTTLKLEGVQEPNIQKMLETHRKELAKQLQASNNK